MNSLTNLLFIIVVSLNHPVTMAFMAPSLPRHLGTKLGDATTEVEATLTAEQLSARTGTTAIFTSEDIDKILPHRYPFALVDRVVEYEAGKRAIGIKSVTKVCISFSLFALFEIQPAHLSCVLLFHFL